MGGSQRAEGHAPLGRALAAARQERGLSVADISAAINLRETVVRAIEHDDFSLCGGAVYARGHLRAYAKVLDLDPAPLLAAYAERTGRPNTPVVPVSESVGPAPSRPRTVPPLRLRRGGQDVPLERQGPNWAVIVGAALTVLVVFLAVQLVLDLRSPGRQTSDVATAVQDTPTTGPGDTGSPTATTTPTDTSSPMATQSPTMSQTTSAGVDVALRFTGDSWVSVRDAAGRTMFSGLLGKGDARNFRDGTSLRLTLGNAGAVQLTVNGKSIGSAGNDGQVVHMKFGPDDPA